VGDPDAVEYLVAWHPPEELFRRFPNLRVVFSIGAGVDQFSLAEFPAGVKLVRMLDPGITQGMVEYVVMGVLALHRNLPAYLDAQRMRRWQALPSKLAQEREVGIMGLGNLGCAVLAQLRGLGFRIRGWSRSQHNIDGACCYAGPDGLKDFLAGCDILVCMLPLTPATIGILCGETFAKLPSGAGLIAAGRGGHMVEKDLLVALASGQLSAAVLDVLNNEPPAQDHPFWEHPQILLTPHIAATTQVESGCSVLLDNIRLHQAGKPIPGEVNRRSGY
jgi:glyoxylate/hydroxypyruvate reductase